MLSAEQILIFLGILVTTVVLMKWMKKKENDNHRSPPSLPSLPLVGSLPFIRNLNDVSVFFTRKAKELGPIFTLRAGTRLVLTLNSKEAMEKAYIKNALTFSDRPKFFLERYFNPEFRGLIFKRNPAEWKKQQLLSLTILKEFGFGVKSTMETRISTEIDAILEFVTDKRGEAFDPNDMCSLASSNVIMNFLFGRRQDYVKGLSKLSSLIHHWASQFSPIYDLVPFIRYVPAFRRQMKDMMDVFESIMQHVKAEIAECLQKSGEPCFVQSYIQKVGPDYDRVELNYLIRDFVAAGTHTTSVSLLWGLVALVNHPDVQKRMRAEIDSVITGDRHPTLHDQTNMPYVEATVLEISRWRTLFPSSLPRESSSDSVVDGYFIPGGTMVIANLYAVHNDVNFWKDPEVFRPGRFLDSENKIIGKDHVIPFSIGRRSCLGETLARAEIFLILTSLVKRFILLPPDGQNKVSDDHVVPVSTVFCPTPFKIRLIERN